MRYLMVCQHTYADGRSGVGNVSVTAAERLTMKDIRALEAGVREINGPACTSVVLLNLIPLADEEAS